MPSAWLSFALSVAPVQNERMVDCPSASRWWFWRTEHNFTGLPGAPFSPAPHAVSRPSEAQSLFVRESAGNFHDQIRREKVHFVLFLLSQTPFANIGGFENNRVPLSGAVSRRWAVSPFGAGELRLSERSPPRISETTGLRTRAGCRRRYPALDQGPAPRGVPCRRRRSIPLQAMSGRFGR